MVYADGDAYRVHWKSILTGATGCGTGSFPRDEAQRYADELNQNIVGLVHWIEPVPENSPSMHTALCDAERVYSGECSCGEDDYTNDNERIS